MKPKRKAKPPPTIAPKRKKTKPPPVLKRKVAKVSKPKEHDHDYDHPDKEPANEVMPGADQGEQSPYADPPEPTRERHPIEAELEAIDAAVIKAQGGPPGSGIKALLALVAAQIGVKIV
jgi:outer membrane biosynthesis protein TonB